VFSLGMGPKIYVSQYYGSRHVYAVLGFVVLFSLYPPGWAGAEIERSPPCGRGSSH
jgi:hypothetical protein